MKLNKEEKKMVREYRDVSNVQRAVKKTNSFLWNIFKAVFFFASAIIILVLLVSWLWSLF